MESTYSDYSTTVICSHSQEQTMPPLSSILTVRTSPVLPPNPPPPGCLPPAEPDFVGLGPKGPKLAASRHSMSVVLSYFTTSGAVLIGAATERGSCLQVRRFMLIKLRVTKCLTSAAESMRISLLHQRAKAGARLFVLRKRTPSESFPVGLQLSLCFCGAF